MNLKECFDVFGGDYNDVMGRLLTEERVKKFLLMFLKDTSFSELETAMQKKDYDCAFRAAHTLKGVCANLSIVKLGEAASRITESLREKDASNAERLFVQLSENYSITIDVLKQLSQN